MAFVEGKSDMERLGIFKEMSYISIGDTYSPPTNREQDLLQLFSACQVSIGNLDLTSLGERVFFCVREKLETLGHKVEP